MIGPVVLDTSVVIKWFRQGEVLAERALAVRDAYLVGQITVSVPSLLAYELANVLRYKQEITTVQVNQAVQSLFDMRFEWLLPTRVVLQRAIEIARAYDTTVYDAVFAALAESSGASFITADERLCQCLSALPYVRFLGEVMGA